MLLEKKMGRQDFVLTSDVCMNGVTQKDSQPIPGIDDTLDTVSAACWFSTLDLAINLESCRLDYLNDIIIFSTISEHFKHLTEIKRV